MLSGKMNSRLFIKQSSIILYHSRRFQHATAVKEVSESVQYPQIFDTSKKFHWQRRIAEWYETVKNVKTVEEKLIKVNMPRYWGFRCFIIDDTKISLNELLSAQFNTRTHIFDESKLPAYYDNLIQPEKLKAIVNDIKEEFYDGIAFELLSRLHFSEESKPFKHDPFALEDYRSDAICKQINRVMLSNLSSSYPHLIDVQTSHNPVVKSYWYSGGIEVDEPTIDLLKRKHHYCGEPMDKKFQFTGSQVLHLRHQLPLNPILPQSESENNQLEVPVFKYDLRTLGRFFKRRHLVSVPGFLPGDSSGFGLISYHNGGYTTSTDYKLDAIRTHAVYNNFGWLSALAYNHGFTTFNDITYPLVNQMIITNGQWWTFCVYQLNTLLMSSHNAEKNPKRNFCWITEPIKLFDAIEDGKLIKLNDKVIENLIKFYVNVPQERVGLDLKPYLEKTAPLVADIEDKERRMWLEKTFRYLISERPRHYLPPETYHWEWIYKMKFKTRPLDKKRTPSDFGINKFTRKFDDHLKEYIPKCLRVVDEQGRGYKNKYRKTYYP